VTHNNSSDIGIDGSYSKNIGNSWLNPLSLTTNFSILNVRTLRRAVLESGHYNDHAYDRPIEHNARLNSSMVSASNILVWEESSRVVPNFCQDYQVTLRAIASTGNAKVLSRPSVVARNHQPATITVANRFR